MTARAQASAACASICARESGRSYSGGGRTVLTPGESQMIDRQLNAKIIKEARYWCEAGDQNACMTLKVFTQPIIPPQIEAQFERLSDQCIFNHSENACDAVEKLINQYNIGR